MAYYRSAGQDFYFPYPVPVLEPFEVNQQGTAIAVPTVIDAHPYPAAVSLSSRTVGLVGNRQCEVETWSAPPGLILKVEGGSDFYIAPDGSEIACTTNASSVAGFDMEILVSPALVLALALRGVWSLHASAIMFKDQVIVFLGESGQGKSTLARYLSTEENPRWQLVADDLLPVKFESGAVNAFPRFPQLKLSTKDQPAINLPERIQLACVCLLERATADADPRVEILSAGQTVQTVLSHTAGTRMFDASLLAKHLDFSAKMAGCIPAYRMIYPHNKNMLPRIKDLVESVC